MMPNVAQFFPGLGGALPPAVRTAEAAGSVDGKVHRFSTSPTMVVDPNAGKDVLKTMDIAKYPSPKPVHPAGSTFATTKDYIAYTVKGGSVRVIHQQSGVKTLLKGQSQQLVDIAFTDMSLATCGEDGLCILWDIIVNGQDDSTTMEAADTLRLRAPVGDGMQRVKFHPKDSHLLFIAHGPTVSGIRLNQQVWEIFKSFPAKESGIPIEQVQSFSITGPSAQKVNDFAFSDDGSMLATAGNDGSVLVYGINPSKDGEIRLLARFDLSKPVVFVSFVLNSVVCGFSHCEELAMINPEGREVHRIRFAAAVSGTAVRFRAASVERGRYIILCDSNVPAMVLVQADETGFKTATTIQLPSPVIAFSVLSNDGSVNVNAVTDALIQVLELPPLNTLLPAPGPILGNNGAPEQRALPSVSQPLPVPPQPGQPKGVGLPPIGQQPGMFQPPPVEQQPRYSPAVPPVFNNSNPQMRPAVNANSGPQSVNMGDFERMLDEKLGFFAGKVEAQIRESEERNKKQLMSLVEAISSTMVDLQPAIQESVVAYFKSPEYAENLAVAIKAGLDASGQKTAVDKAVKAALPHAMKELGESLTTQLNTRIQQNLNKSFEEAFRQRLVPAFEAGCTNMLRQFEGALNRRSAGGFAEDLKAKENLQESIDDAIGQGDFALALERAVSSDDPNILTSTCDKVDFTNLLAGGYSLSQTLLVNLLRAFAKNITHEPSKRLEWIETISTGNIDRTSPEIADILPSVALQAKDALVSNSEIFAKLGTTRFRSAVFLLNVLAGGV